MSANEQVIFAVPIEAHDAAGVDVGAICWGSCGKGNVGGIGLGEYGSAIPCSVPADECPHLDRELPDFGTVPLSPDGPEVNVTLRKLTAALRKARGEE